jgi:hypothetical protein
MGGRCRRRTRARPARWYGSGSVLRAIGWPTRFPDKCRSSSSLTHPLETLQAPTRAAPSGRCSAGPIPARRRAIAQTCRRLPGPSPGMPWCPRRERTAAPRLHPVIRDEPLASALCRFTRGGLATWRQGFAARIVPECVGFERRGGVFGVGPDPAASPTQPFTNRQFRSGPYGSSRGQPIEDQ